MIDSLQQISQQIASHKKSSETTPTSPFPASLAIDLKKIADQLTNLEKDSSQISSQLKLISNSSQRNYYWLVFLLAYLGFQLAAQKNS